MIGNPRLLIETLVNATGIGIGIKSQCRRNHNWNQIYWFAKHWNQNRNHMMLEFKSESESQFFKQHRNQNQNHLLLESELESESWI